MGYRQRENSVVREAGSLLKKREVSGLDGAAFIDRTDDIPCDSSEYGGLLLEGYDLK